MSKDISTFIGDFVRWIFALLSIPIIIGLIHLSFVYPFEWAISFTSRFNWFIHFVLWLLFGGMYYYISMSIVMMVIMFFSNIVRQKMFFIVGIEVIIIITILSLLYMLWSGNMQYSWQQYNHQLTNKIMFSITALLLITAPLPLMDAAEKRR